MYILFQVFFRKVGFQSCQKLSNYKERHFCYLITIFKYDCQLLFTVHYIIKSKRQNMNLLTVFFPDYSISSFSKKEFVNLKLAASDPGKGNTETARIFNTDSYFYDQNYLTIN